MKIIPQAIWALSAFCFSLISLFAEANQTNSVIAEKSKTAEIAPNFHREVRPILESTCVECHGIEKQKGGLRLDTLAYAQKRR